MFARQVQLCAITGSVFPDAATRAHYVDRLFDGIQPLLTLAVAATTAAAAASGASDDLDSESDLVVDTVDMCVRVLTHFDVWNTGRVSAATTTAAAASVAAASSSRLPAFLHSLAELTTALIAVSARCDMQQDTEHAWADDALDVVFNAWNLLATQYTTLQRKASAASSAFAFAAAASSAITVPEFEGHCMTVLKSYLDHKLQSPRRYAV